MHYRAVHFCVGAGIGLGIALLIAPKSGKDTRSLIRDKATDGAAYIKRSGMEVRDKVFKLVRRPTEAVAQQKGGLVAALRADRRAYSIAVNA